jgi:hypothetical protein
MARTSPTARQLANLVPFGQDPEGRALASEMGKRSAEVRRTKKELELRSAKLDPGKARNSQQTVRILSDIVTKHRDNDLSELARACVCELIERLATGEVPLKSAADVASALQVVHQVGLLEEGQPTSIGMSVSASMSSADAIARLQELRSSGHASTPSVGLQPNATTET